MALLLNSTSGIKRGCSGQGTDRDAGKGGHAGKVKRYGRQGQVKRAGDARFRLRGNGGGGEPWPYLALFGLWLLLAARLEMGPPWPRLALRSLVSTGPVDLMVALVCLVRSGQEWQNFYFLLISAHFLSFPLVDGGDGGRDASLAGFTNEVQHQIKVLPWDTHRSPLRNGVRLPAYVPRAPRSGRSLQAWIARHRRLLGS